MLIKYSYIYFRKSTQFLTEFSCLQSNNYDYILVNTEFSVQLVLKFYPSCYLGLCNAIKLCVRNSVRLCKQE